MAEQYLSTEPTSKDMRHTLNVTLRGHEVTARMSSGVFSGSHVDLGTSVLLKYAPEPPLTGDFLDLDRSWGPIALTLTFGSPEANVWMVDVSERVVDLTHANVQTSGHASIHTAQMDGSSTPPPTENQSTFCEMVPDDLMFDVIWLDPPIRVDKGAPHTLLMAQLPKLKMDDAACLVVQKDLGSDSLIPWLDDVPGEGFAASRHASSKGFRIIEVCREI